MGKQAFSVDSGRSEIYSFDPADLRLDETLNARAYEHDEAAILALVDSFADVGQIQPVTITKDKATGDPVVVAGYRRVLAARKYNEIHSDKPMKVKATLVSNLTDETAFIRNLRENKDRKDLSPMDVCHNMSRLMTDFSWDKKQVAEFYSLSTIMVDRYMRMSELSEDLQAKVHAGEISFTAAFDLLSLPAEAQAELAADPKRVRAKTKAKKREMAVSGKGPKKGRKTQQRNLKEIKAFLEESTGLENEVVREAVSVMLRYIKGELTDKAAIEVLESL